MEMRRGGQGVKTSLGWLLLKHVVAFETWLHLGLPAEVAPVTTLLLVGLTAVLFAAVVQSVRLFCAPGAQSGVVRDARAAGIPGRLSPRPRVSLLLDSGNGPRAPGGFFHPAIGTALAA